MNAFSLPPPPRPFFTLIPECFVVHYHISAYNYHCIFLPIRTFQLLLFYFFGDGKPIDWPIAPQKMKLWRLLKIGGFVLMYIVPPVHLDYRGEWRTTFAKAYGSKVRYLYEEHATEHIGNPLGT
jgi:hypothetical protein